MSKTQQALLSFGIRALAIGAIAILDFVSKNLTGLQLPVPEVSVPILGLVISEADTWLVKWEANNPQ